ncbi:MAG: hypothetical protein HRT66_08960 [Flavobacteriaceae bacterium]|nr:hypothetical protein [Flavobacteriaceae bacterium]
MTYASGFAGVVEYILYVDGGGGNDGKNGENWENAFASVKKVLENNSVTKIYVAGGVYKYDEGGSLNIDIPVEIYGGFIPELDKTSIEARNERITIGTNLRSSVLEGCYRVNLDIKFFDSYEKGNEDGSGNEYAYGAFVKTAARSGDQEIDSE